MIGIPLGLLYANASEWVIHKYVLHEGGRRKRGFWQFHWVEHHRNVRLHEMHDPDYERPVIGKHAQGKEALGLAVAALAHLPLLPIAPFFTGAVLYSIGRYYYVHKRSHMDPAWAREHLPWHYDHHMGPDQDKNWCVTRPWFDHVMGTRVPYVGTELERKDRERRERAAQRKRERAAQADTASTAPSAPTEQERAARAA